MVKFSEIKQVEVHGGSGWMWDYVSHATVNDKPAGSIHASSRESCQEQIDYALANPDEYVSWAMRSGNL